MKWTNFFNQLQQDLKVFFSIWLLLCLFRIGFILCMNRYISPSTDWTDFVLNFYYGMKMSLKSAGIALLFTFLFSSAAATCTKQNKFSIYPLFYRKCVYHTYLHIIYGKICFL